VIGLILNGHSVTPLWLETPSSRSLTNFTFHSSSFTLQLLPPTTNHILPLQTTHHITYSSKWARTAILPVSRHTYQHARKHRRRGIGRFIIYRRHRQRILFVTKDWTRHRQHILVVTKDLHSPSPLLRLPPYSRLATFQESSTARQVLTVSFR
jgi:hypothetical protein